VGEVIALLGAADEEMAEPPSRKPVPPVADRRIEKPRPAAAGDGQSEEQLAAADQGPPGAQPAVEAASEHPQQQPDEGGAQPAERAAPRRAAATATQEAPPTRADGRVRISPVARRIATDAGIDPEQLKGSGPDGRVLRRDVEAAVAQTRQAPAAPAAAAQGGAARPAPAARGGGGASETLPLTRMRQAIARRMSQSKQMAPHYYLTLDVDMTAALAFREQFNAAAGEDHRASINDLIVKACAIALQRHPRFNGEFAEDGIRVYEHINVAIGVALDDGLIAPAILDVGNKTLGTIAAEARDLAGRARGGKLSADEYTAGTFTITNLGAFGVETLIGIINPPQAAILGVGSVMPQAVVRDGQIVVRQVMKVALSADHRVTDGAEGARFIKEIQGLLENPAALAI
jgi:pyruvate dehydrogenase E2 component (dihydrolipoamide acetyltransferase)